MGPGTLAAALDLLTSSAMSSGQPGWWPLRLEGCAAVTPMLSVSLPRQRHRTVAPRTNYVVRLLVPAISGGYTTGTVGHGPGITGRGFDWCFLQAVKND